jgi:hypothetical protein
LRASSDGSICIGNTVAQLRSAELSKPQQSAQLHLAQLQMKLHMADRQPAPFHNHDLQIGRQRKLADEGALS